jgi:K+-transporting ATPase ATPase A chain
VLWAVTTTDSSCGAVNAMHDSLMPLTGMVTLINLMLGCIAFGGVGAGLYGILLHVVLAVFIAGLMVGRTPEYLGKKIEAREIKLAIFAIFAVTIGILFFAAAAAVLPAGLAGLGNNGPHGLSEILYAFSSTDANNGSAFAGLSVNTLFYNAMLGAMMLIGRFMVIVPILALAGSFAAKKTIPASSGTFPTDSGLFVALLIGVIVIVGGLTFFPALALGPIVEHLALQSGQLF